jgi:molybdopterin synthase catalytic subunit
MHAMKKVAKKKQQNIAKGSVTLDSLAGMVASGFTELRGEMNERFGEVNARFEHIDGRIEVMDQKLSLLRSEVMSMHYDYKKMVARTENLELRVFGSVQE